jgi:predicted sugar kinase
MGLNFGQFRIGSGWKLRLKTVLDHGGVGRGNEIEVQWLVSRHIGLGSSNAKSQPIMFE